MATVSYLMGALLAVSAAGAQASDTPLDLTRNPFSLANAHWAPVSVDSPLVYRDFEYATAVTSLTRISRVKPTAHTLLVTRYRAPVPALAPAPSAPQVESEPAQSAPPSPQKGEGEIIIIDPPPITDDPEPPPAEGPIRVGGPIDAGFRPIKTQHHRMGKPEAARLLQQATFGPRAGDVQRLQKMGLKSWLQWQRDLPRSEHLPLLETYYRTQYEQRQQDRADVWWQHALYGEDQLRQRMAFALSEILVISRQDAVLFYQPLSMAHYYDMLSEHALGNYRDLLKGVTLHPAMGIYLSMRGNLLADETSNRFPDENYAREVMQLFSIGLHQLNDDGTPVYDANGELVPTYTQTDIENLARVFTGWDIDGQFCRLVCDSMVPMAGTPERHDDGEKWVMGEYFPAGQGMEADLDQAMDLLVHHPNTPAFISQQLIQRLTHSNPSPAYVKRVADVFRNNGFGERGDLFAVVSAILMDPENLQYYPRRSPRKVREPLVATAALARALEMQLAGDRMVDYFKSYSSYGQAPLAAPSVFNFFSPDYSQGAVAQMGLVAPELSILGWNTYIGFNNRLWGISGSLTEGLDGTLFFGAETLAGMPAQRYVDWLDERLFAYRMSQGLKDLLLDHLAGIPPSELERRVQEPLYLALTAPEYLYQE
ncbi:DUF1800 family protein [Ferrimonas balearica]|uniref:DUF1800 domain-containing protein n=1 Tax=Ferrimonas balearica TaxID=44012 RepID=UPI001C990960|nr:DUF1800 domain-containing protein [Ferrimonas balearica]MBY5992188.1 DUF1800 domain-containing protein [Ferrimonas balearica]